MRPIILSLLSTIASKGGRTVLVLVGVLTLVFAVLRAVPGDPALSILGDQAPPEDLARLREAMGLNQPLWVQYTDYVGQVFDGTLGRPFSHVRGDSSVSQLIGGVFPYTLELALAAVFIAMLIAFPLGVWSARRKGSLTDNLALMATLVGVAMPGFWLGPLLIHLTCVNLGWLPDPAAGVTGLGSLVLPAFVLGLALSAKLTRMVRSSMLDVMQEPYVLAARARGISERRIIVRHVFKNALIPVVTVLGLQFAALLSGAIVTEKVFARPGIGTLLLEGIAQRDYAIVQGTALVIGSIYVAVNLVVDMLYTVIDPRIAAARFGGKP